MFAVNGIVSTMNLFFGEKPLSLVRLQELAAGLPLDFDFCYLGNLDACRDWDHAEDYVRSMRLMLQQNRPEDLVIATGINISVRDFARRSFEALGIKLHFKGEGKNEITGVERYENPDYQLPAGKVVIKKDPVYYRHTEVELLAGDPSKAIQKLGWELKRC